MMIKIETTTALILYLGFFLSLCFAAWLLSHLKQRKKGPLPPLYTLLRCEYCQHAYLAETGRELSRCPECRCLNRSAISK